MGWVCVLLAVMPLRLVAQDLETVLDGSTSIISRFTAIGVAQSTILVPDQDENRVLLVNSRGGAHLSFGREGSGPGEFRRIGRLGAYGTDGFWVEDRMQMRLHLISPDAKSLGERPIPTRIGTHDDRSGADFMSNAGVRAAYTDGLMLVEVSAPGERAFSANWTGRSSSGDDVAFALVDSSGTVRRIAGWRRGVRRCFASPTGVTMRTPLCADPIVEVSPSGDRVLFIEGDADAGKGRSRQFQVVIVDRKGSPVRTSTISYAPLRISATVRDSMVEGVAKVFPPDMAKAIRAAPVPGFFYPVRTAVVADDGSFALEVWDADFDHRYRIFGSDGIERPSVTLPSSDTVIGMTGVFYYVLRTDTDGIQTLLRGRR
ncbi:MAG TPA: hypothetical protein VFN22_02700 [Gemmatimonadales bacterium]|nr:hypothetical protein [Gemmatimonadales bacterium]